MFFSQLLADSFGSFSPQQLSFRKDDIKTVNAGSELLISFEVHMVFLLLCLFGV